MSADGTITFKDWLPDLPDLDNPGLTEATNVLPVDGVYRSFPTLSASSTTLNGRAQGALILQVTPSSFQTFIGTASKLYVTDVDKSAATYNTASNGFWRFSLFGDKVIATNGVDLPQYRSVSTTGSFATLGSSSGTAPAASHVGTVGQFVVLGNLASAQKNFVRWSGIGAPLSWPTPASATAIAQQSGQQELNYGYGAVTGIAEGDQHGVVFQESGITRMTYIGGNAVFQFDDIEAGRGAVFPNAIVRVGQLNYFPSADGFFVTDGVSVKPIGKGKADRYFAAQVDVTYRERVYGALDARNRCIWWGFPTSAATSGMPNRILIYNYEEERWSLAEANQEVLTTYGGPSTAFTSAVLGFTSAFRWGYFASTPGTAILASAEIEPNPGGFARIKGIKPLVDQAAITVAMGTRNDRTSAVTYSSEVTANARSGFADFRNEARYHRARLTIAGTFNAAQGLEYSVALSGDT